MGWAGLTFAIGLSGIGAPGFFVEKSGITGCPFFFIKQLRGKIEMLTLLIMQRNSPEAEWVISSKTDNSASARADNTPSRPLPISMDVVDPQRLESDCRSGLAQCRSGHNLQDPRCTVA